MRAMSEKHLIIFVAFLTYFGLSEQRWYSILFPDHVVELHMREFWLRQTLLYTLTNMSVINPHRDIANNALQEVNHMREPLRTNGTRSVHQKDNINLVRTF